MKDGEVVGRGRGCMRGNSNYTCTEAFLEEQCTELENGEKVSCDIHILTKSPTVLDLLPENLLAYRNTELSQKVKRLENAQSCRRDVKSNSEQ